MNERKARRSHNCNETLVEATLLPQAPNGKSPTLTLILRERLRFPKHLLLLLLSDQLVQRVDEPRNS
jgi:hypothetical protein